MKTQHTPGPRRIFDCEVGKSKRHLIAAAPDLFEACNEAEGEIDTLLSHPVPTDALAARKAYLRELMDILRAAIAKATGGQS